MCFFLSKELAVKLKAQLEEMRKTKELQESQALESGDSRRSEESGTDSSSSSDAEEEEKKKKELVIPAKKITEADLNEIGAKIVKAEIMGNDVRIAHFQILFLTNNLKIN